MSYKIKDNPEGCAYGKPLHGETCSACYWSQVKDGQWVGNRKCWDAQCMVYDGKGE